MKILERIKNLFRKEGNITDGYHTFDELYDYRMLYNAAFFNFLASLPGNPYNVYMSFCHSDGKLCFDGHWFIVMANLPTGQVSNHYKVSDLAYFHCVPLRKKADVWDGHSPEGAKVRIAKYIRKNQYRDIINMMFNIKTKQIMTLEEAKKIKQLQDYIVSQNNIIAKQSGKISSLNGKITKKNKVISKKSRMIKDKDAVLTDVAEELRLSKVREKNLVELCQKHLKEIDELKDLVDDISLKYDGAKHNLRLRIEECENLKKKCDDFAKMLAKKEMLIGWVRNASKEYYDYGLAAEKYIQKLAKIIVASGCSIDDFRDYEKVHKLANGGRFQIPLNEETKKEIDDIASGKDGGEPELDERNIADIINSYL